MLILNPRSVKFGGATWDDVTMVAVDREAHRHVQEWGDLGPHAVVVDVPEQRVRVRVVRNVGAGDIDVPRPGDAATLTLYTAPAGNELRRRRVSCAAVVLGVSHQLSSAGATRTVTLIAVSSDGAADPVSVVDA